MKDPKRLCRITSIKARIRDARRAELSRATDALTEAHQHAEQANALLDSAIRRLTSAGELNAGELADRAAFVADADADASRAEDEVSRRSYIRETRRTEATDAARDVAVLERLGDRLREEAQREERIEEQREADEAIATRWAG